ncbi:hypothetical protein DXG01_011235 [Tephrocybe rancida]|nr:hypothetical protein DXG01_011235 [Tephrocybe rancida]
MSQRQADIKVSPTRLVSANADQRELPNWTLVDNASEDNAQHHRHMQRLVISLDRDRAWAAHPTILLLVLRQFDAPLPSLDQSLDSVRDIAETIAAALEGVSFALMETTRKVLPEIMISWPAIWKWIVYLYRQHNAVREAKPTAGWKEQYAGLMYDILALIERTFSLMISPHDPNTVISSTPGALELSLKMWIRQADLPTDEIHVGWEIQSTCEAVTTLFNNLKDSRVREIAAFMGPNQTDLGRRILDPLRTIIYRDMNWLIVYPDVIYALSSVISQIPALLEDPRQTETVFSHICHVLSRITSLSNVSSHTKGNITRGLIASFSFLCQFALNVAETHVWVLQLLRLRFMEYLIQAAPYTDDEAVFAGVALILRELQAHLVFRPVVKLLYRMTTSEDFVSIAAEISEYQSFWELWSAFSYSVNEAWKAQEDFRALVPNKRRCGYPQCAVAEGPVPFQICSSWNNYLSLPKVVAFFTHLVVKELKTHREAIIADRDRLLSGTTRQALLLTLDYTRLNKSFPPKYTIGLLRDVLPDYIPLLPPYHSVVIPSVRVQYGKAFQQMPMPMDVAGQMFGWCVGSGSRFGGYAGGVGLHVGAVGLD